MKKTMPNSMMESLLNRIIDYAGLFPPAQLDMQQAVSNYAEYLASDDAWMLGRLIVPVARLGEFEQHAGPLLPRDDRQHDPWTISAITSPAGSEELAEEIERIQAFNAEHEKSANGLACIDAVEMRGDTAANIDRTLDRIPDEIYPYFEIPIVDDPRGRIAVLVGSEAGAKVRTGGVKPEMYPKTAHLARFITTCAAADVPFKATAGLHHPLRHFSEAMGAKEFGFLNVFIAACFAMSNELGQEAIAALLEEESADAFVLEENRLGWHDHAIDADSVTDVRESFASSFGSCSFDEPRVELRKLNLL